MKPFLLVAQWIESRFPKAMVGGSNPSKEAMSRLRCPNGFRMRLVTSMVLSDAYESGVLPADETEALKIELRKTSDNEMIGWVDVVKTTDEFWETHSYLDEEHRGNGFGTLMYARAIDAALKRGDLVKSSSRTSAMAMRVWESQQLNDLFEIQRMSARYHVISRKTQRH